MYFYYMKFEWPGPYLNNLNPELINLHVHVYTCVLL